MALAIPIIGGAISALGNVLGGVFGGNATKNANRESANTAERMFHLNNEYNTPLNQRKRLEAAGLNPALMYGGGGVSNTSSAPRAPDAQPNNAGRDISMGVSRAVDAFMQYALMDKQRELIDSNVAKNAQSVVTAQQDMTLKDYQLNKIMPAQYGDLVARTAESVSRKGKLETMLPSELQARQLGNDKLVEEIALTKTNRIATELENVASGIRNSYLDEREKQSLLLLTQNVENAVQQGVLNGQTFSNREIEGLINVEILKLRKEGFSPNDAAWIRQLQMRLAPLLNNENDALKNVLYRGGGGTLKW